MNELLDTAKEIFEKNSETTGYIPDYVNDYCFFIDNYIFVIQTRNGFNNIIFAKSGKCFCTLKNVFEQLVMKLKQLGINYVRVEGSKKRYNFLTRMFNYPYAVEPNDNRNIFYFKISGEVNEA